MAVAPFRRQGPDSHDLAGRAGRQVLPGRDRAPADRIQDRGHDGLEDARRRVGHRRRHRSRPLLRPPIEHQQRKLTHCQRRIIRVRNSRTQRRTQLDDPLEALREPQLPLPGPHPFDVGRGHLAGPAEGRTGVEIVALGGRDEQRQRPELLRLGHRTRRLAVVPGDPGQMLTIPLSPPRRPRHVPTLTSPGAPRQQISATPCATRRPAGRRCRRSGRRRRSARARPGRPPGRRAARRAGPWPAASRRRRRMRPGWPGTPTGPW